MVEDSLDVDCLATMKVSLIEEVAGRQKTMRL